MRTIWKFPFRILDRFEIQMPAGAEILHVEEQDGVPCMWALVESTEIKITAVFYVVGTGNPMPVPERGWQLEHCGTFISAPFVWHLFMRDVEESHQ